MWNRNNSLRNKTLTLSIYKQVDNSELKGATLLWEKLTQNDEFRDISSKCYWTLKKQENPLGFLMVTSIKRLEKTQTGLSFTTTPRRDRREFCLQWLKNFTPNQIISKSKSKRQTCWICKNWEKFNPMYETLVHFYCAF